MFATQSAGKLLARLVEGAFRVASSVRNARAFHPRGSVWHGEFELHTPLPGDHALARRGTAPALARFSFGAGLPRPLPDFHGIALRIVDAYGTDRPQDVLLVSSMPPPVVRHVLLPVPSGRRTLHSSILPYTPRGERLLLGARVVGAPSADACGAASFDLLVASLRGAWRPCGRFTLQRRAGDDVVAALHFDPWNTGGDLEPSGFLNALRLPAYRGSRRGRGAALEGAPGVAGRQ